jgi:hypothetical protein
MSGLKVLRKGYSTLSDLKDGGSVHGYPGAYDGMVYYVNNITGNDGNDGLTWDTAFAQLSTAITASEAFRATSWGGATLTNHTLRNIIYVQGTGTPYTLCAAVPSFCDIIGIGAVSHGNGTGIASISGAGAADAVAGTARGLHLHNLQFIATGNFWCVDFTSLFRSEISYCTFQALTTATYGGLRFSASSGGNWVHHNHWGGSGEVIPVVGIQAQAQNFDHNRFEYNIITGTTAGVLIDAAVTKGDMSVFQENVIGDLGRGCVTAIDDNATAGMINYVKNSVMGTNLICCYNNGAARVHGNVSANGFVAVTAS